MPAQGAVSSVPPGTGIASCCLCGQYILIAALTAVVHTGEPGPRGPRLNSQECQASQLQVAVQVTLLLGLIAGLLAVCADISLGLYTDSKSNQGLQVYCSMACQVPMPSGTAAQGAVCSC